MDDAQRDFEEIRMRVAIDSPAAAVALTERLAAAVFELAVFPLRSPVLPRRRASGAVVRHTVCLNHRIIYAVDGHVVGILRVIHAARRIPRRLTGM